MEAVVLAGGLGTRLKPVIQDIPKPMAPIGEKPFLEYIFEYLHQYGVKRVILATGYKHEVIERHFGRRYKNISVHYSVENEPLGTGGGLKKAFAKVNDDKVFILNGDSFFDVRLNELARQHLLLNSDLTLSLKAMQAFDRYGAVVTEGNRVIKFMEKNRQKYGHINGGVYLADSGLFNRFKLPERFSFETDFMKKNLAMLNICAFVADSFFIDIGVPEDYKKAQTALVKYI